MTEERWVCLDLLAIKVKLATMVQKAPLDLRALLGKRVMQERGLLVVQS